MMSINPNDRSSLPALTPKLMVVLLAALLVILFIAALTSVRGKTAELYLELLRMLPGWPWW